MHIITLFTFLVFPFLTFGQMEKLKHLAAKKTAENIVKLTQEKHHDALAALLTKTIFAPDKIQRLINYELLKITPPRRISRHRYNSIKVNGEFICEEKKNENALYIQHIASRKQIIPTKRTDLLNHKINSKTNQEVEFSLEEKLLLGCYTKRKRTQKPKQTLRLWNLSSNDFFEISNILPLDTQSKKNLLTDTQSNLLCYRKALQGESSQFAILNTQNKKSVALSIPAGETFIPLGFARNGTQFLGKNGKQTTFCFSTDTGKLLFTLPIPDCQLSPQKNYVLGEKYKVTSGKISKDTILYELKEGKEIVNLNNTSSLLMDPAEKKVFVITEKDGKKIVTIYEIHSNKLQTSYTLPEKCNKIGLTSMRLYAINDHKMIIESRGLGKINQKFCIIHLNENDAPEQKSIPLEKFRTQQDPRFPQLMFRNNIIFCTQSLSFDKSGETTPIGIMIFDSKKNRVDQKLICAQPKAFPAQNLYTFEYLNHQPDHIKEIKGFSESMDPTIKSNLKQQGTWAQFVDLKETAQEITPIQATAVWLYARWSALPNAKINSDPNGSSWEEYINKFPTIKQHIIKDVPECIAYITPNE